MNDHALASLDAVATAERIKSGEMTAREAVDAAILRGERSNPKLHAIVAPCYERARRQADDAPKGLFGGVPTFHKDLNDLPGVPTGFGSRAFAGYVPDANPFPFFKAFDEMGFVSLGKSSTPEFGLTATTEPASREPTRNPWNLAHSCGGSSGGAAALVAAGVVPVAHASDGGGSIRIPSSCCGVFGLKVTRGRYPAAYDEAPVPIILSMNGVISRSVRDTAVFYAGMARRDGDLPPAERVERPGRRRLRIGMFTTAPQGTSVDPKVVEATRAAARLCEKLGHAVEDVAPPYDAAAADDFFLYWAALAARAVGDWEAMSGRRYGYAEFEAFTLGLVGHYETHKARMEGAVRRLSQFGAMFEAAFGPFDLFLSPITAAPPPPIGYLNPNFAYPVVVERLFAYAPFTGAVNLAGTPAMSVPLNMADGLPVGAHFMAKSGDERTLLELAF